MKNKKTTTHLVSKGFTILELLMVMLMITLLIAMVLVGFSRAKKNVNDDELLANLDLVRLGLEQYHSQCKVYPDQLDRTANNGYPGSPLCPVTLNDFLDAFQSRFAKTYRLAFFRVKFLYSLLV